MTHQHRPRLFRHDDGTLEQLSPRCVDCLEEGAREERERLRNEFARYWDWLVEQRLYGNGGGWGEAAMLKVSSLLAGEREKT